MRHALRLLTLCLVVFSGAALAEESPATPPDPARVAAARDLLEVTGVTKQMDGMVEAMSRGFAKGANADNSEAGKKLSAQFDSSMKKLLEYKDQMITDFANLYAETFTAEEMKTVADFYRSGPGAKFITMTPELMKKGAEIGMKYSSKIADEMKAGQTPAGQQ
ncbi:MAG: DUF2059 domain-containing protein [Hyphomicrobium sp.]